MGHGMAKNIRMKVSPQSMLTVYDVSAPAMERFMREFEGANVSVAASPKGVAEVSVSRLFFLVLYTLTILPHSATSHHCPGSSRESLADRACQ